MDNTFSPLSRLTPHQHQALYEHAKREAHVLRQQAIAEAAAWLAHGARALWQAARRGGAAAITARPEATACPR